ncbi:FKBP-type peptidyl-prolyl cis-trans isomerase [Nocardioides sp. zg-1228]|uniref:FKBP-type peptidyl-prolyl cis-trans isomerase n=1 Tax=Nocardioides sp. zg-1228 TaxID=2763008 RepID=UPI0016426EA2|nr:FKBP-type peptidyl-prolyl cis-trans isomerase [Nocardioides sp. zg-1228]MBC2934596.1 FKBP-type peptidyl-prolyl cis-trans isomerase [Nocardioides sp. zg-1228]QSF59346.1 FKBP-type peptidyl-prolyl cis-trans isomerase [Nocardioides sp. zg-1228]
MSRVRSAALSGVLALSMLGLAACGSESSDTDEGGAPLSSVTIEGKQGEEPKVTFDGRLDGSKDETEVLVEGDGDEVADGDTVQANWWIGNGFTEEEAQSTWTKGGGTKSVEMADDVLPFLREAIIGNQVGDRVVLLTSAEKAFGEGGRPDIGIGNRDAVLAVVDILGTAETVPPLDGPQGEKKKPAGWAPSLVEKDGVITGLDFTTAHEPSGELIATTLVKGDGAKVKAGQTLTVDYLGQVYGADAPFDESYSGEPAEFPIGVGQVIPGWDERLVGRTVGSRVIIEIPPAKGYGGKGNDQAGIKGTDTLFFVVDILAAS